MDSTGTAPGSGDDSSLSSQTPPRAATFAGATSTGPEQELLAWLSGAAGLQSGAAATPVGQTAEGPTAVGPTTAGGPAGGPGTTGAAAAAVFAFAASGTLSSQEATTSPTPSTSSDADRTDALSSDPSQSASALLATNANAVHLAAASHAGVAQQPAGVLQSPLGTSAWVEELGAQLSWMANQGIETASLHVSPAELGPIEVRIAVHGGDASVWFGAAQPTTRAALEQALPQLRQLFASHGLALADAGVFREPPRGSARQAPPRSVAPVAGVSDATSSRTAETRTAARVGLVDLYA